MTTHRLNTGKLIRDVDRVRRAGAPDEISYRQIARLIGVHASMFTRLNNGFCPEANALCSLLMWLNPEARLSDYTLPEARPSTRLRSPAITPAMS